MLGAIAAVLIVLWLLGFFAFHVSSAVVHVLPGNRYSDARPAFLQGQRSHSLKYWSSDVMRGNLTLLVRGCLTSMRVTRTPKRINSRIDRPCPGSLLLELPVEGSGDIDGRANGLLFHAPIFP